MAHLKIGQELQHCWHWFQLWDIPMHLCQPLLPGPQFRWVRHLRSLAPHPGPPRPNSGIKMEAAAEVTVAWMAEWVEHWVKEGD